MKHTLKAGYNAKKSPGMNIENPPQGDHAGSWLTDIPRI